jgi:PTS system nitrogen regulatory IIA component
MNLTVRHVAQLLAISERTVYRWIDQGTIPVYRVNDQYRFNRAELLEWATAHRLRVSADLFSEPESRDQPIPALSESLALGGICYRVEGADKSTVLRSIVEVMRLPEEVDRVWLLEMLLARESLGSTAIGDGLAIPHVRYPIVMHTPTPMVTLCFLDTPIDFGALDGQPVHALFTLISPTVRAHLNLLSRLAFVLRDEEVRQVLRHQARREEVLTAIRRVEQTMTGAAAAPKAGGA